MEGLCRKPFKDFMIVDGFLFKGNALYIPSCSLRLNTVDEFHGGTLGGHFGREKTLALVKVNFSWAKVKRMLQNLCLDVLFV